jgi:DNA-directed RNA polymerase subunit M/transcription elongation factor TFIIS
MRIKRNIKDTKSNSDLIIPDKPMETDPVDKLVQDAIKQYDPKVIQYMIDNIDRQQGKQLLLQAIQRVNNCDQMSNDIENGVYEFTALFSKVNDITTPLIPAIYRDKIHDLVYNLDENSPSGNKYLLAKIQSGEVNPKRIAFFSPDQLFPDQWQDITAKNEMRVKQSTTIETTDLYTCRKCGERKSTSRTLQLRGLDEPSTCFVTCIVCGHTFKF